MVIEVPVPIGISSLDTGACASVSHEATGGGGGAGVVASEPVEYSRRRTMTCP